MPFDYDDYRKECKNFSDDGLQAEYKKYIRLLGSSSASTGISTGLAIFTFGISLIGTAAGAAAARNAIKKSDIIEEEASRRGICVTFRKRDFFTGYGTGCTIGAVTHGTCGHLAASGVEHVIHHTANHAANTAVAHTTATVSTSGSDSTVKKLVENGVDKASEKAVGSLERHLYDEEIVNSKLTPWLKSGDGEFDSPVVPVVVNEEPIADSAYFRTYVGHAYDTLTVEIDGFDWALGVDTSLIGTERELQGC